MKRPGLRFLIVMTALVTQAGAQQPATFVPSSDPEDLILSGGRLIFTAFDGLRGRRLWYLEDPKGVARPAPIFQAASLGGGVSKIAAMGDRLVVFTEDGAGCSVWVTDSDFSDPALISSRFSSPPDTCVTVGNRLFFSAEQPETGKETWVVDGEVSPAEVRIVNDFIPGPMGSAPMEKGPGVSKGGEFFFTAGIPDVNTTVCVVDRQLNFRSLRKVDVGTGAFTPLNDLMAFTSSDPNLGWELWVSDGTPTGTRQLADLAPGTPSGHPSEMFPVEGGMLFQADDGELGRELWFSDGTEAGTRMIADIYPGKESSAPYKFTKVGSKVFFNAVHPEWGLELWVLDCHSMVPQLVKDIAPGQAPSETYELCALGDKIVFSSHHPTWGEEIWVSDGTEAGTFLLKDIYPGEGGSSPYFQTTFEGYVVFAASNPEHGRELWRTDGTPEGTLLLQDLYREAVVNPSSSPVELTSVGDLLYFVVNDGEHGAEVWMTDGTTVGTRMVKDIVEGPASSDPRELTSYRYTLYFVALSPDQRGERIYFVSRDGRTVHTIDPPSAAGPFPGYRDLTPSGSVLYFTADDGVSGRELWGLRDFAPGVIKDIAQGTRGSNPRGFKVWRDVLYFLADDGVRGEELWRSDGTHDGTYMVRDIALPPIGNSSVSQLTPAGWNIFFVAEDGNHGLELWRSDGSSAGTRIVRDIRRPYPAGVDPFR